MRAMAERTFTANEVNAALGWNWSGISVTESEIVAWWESHWLDEPFHIAALALGVLPEGWEDNGVWYSCTTQFGYANPDTMQVRFDNWPEAVRTGQAEIACRLIAAHVELERIKAKKGGGE